MQVNTEKAASRVWFITGASSGLGHAVSAAALARGDRVAATARKPTALAALASKHPERLLALQLDVADAQAARQTIDRAVAHFGRIDIVFNNAGYGHIGAIEELSDAELRRQLEVNLLGVINVTRAALPHLRKQRSGHLVQMSSLNGVEGLVGGGYYAASKFAVEGLSESLAQEVADLGIKVMIVEPGPLRTRFLNDKSAKWAKSIADYADSVGKGRETLRAMDGKQPGDPQRAAHAILKAIDADRPPLRLPLGRIAIQHIRSGLEAKRKQLDAWAELGATADFPQREHTDLIRSAYAAFNDRRIEAGVQLMEPEVDWPKVPEGGFVHGRDEVRRHWDEQFSRTNPQIQVEEVKERGNDCVEAHVRQIVRDTDGQKLADDRLVHVFTIANDRIARMEISDHGLIARNSK
jgi:NAD(P)-dependent dehydrogenase (short-subunit alcohol dehydrogenase family)